MRLVFAVTAIVLCWVGLDGLVPPRTVVYWGNETTILPAPCARAVVFSETCRPERRLLHHSGGGSSSSAPNTIVATVPDDPRHTLRVPTDDYHYCTTLLTSPTNEVAYDGVFVVRCDDPEPEKTLSVGLVVLGVAMLVVACLCADDADVARRMM
jgi:hypothetical protein